MLPVLITVDTEYNFAAWRDGSAASLAENAALSIDCRARDGSLWGVGHQMDLLDRYGQRGVFFVDPMAALVWGPRAVDHVVHPILARGHDVQLHCHSEWLDAAPRNPITARRGSNMHDFPLADQIALLQWGIERLVESGAPRPVAFRAGNYGANDDTLRALAAVGLRYDSSVTPGFADSACSIDGRAGDIRPVERHGVVELPVAAMGSSRDGLRHVQLTAISGREMRAAIRHAARASWPAFTLVSHSFELFHRQRRLGNRIVERRFESLCAFLANDPSANSATFKDLAGPWAPPLTTTTDAELALPRISRRREWERLGEQAIVRFGESDWRPALSGRVMSAMALAGVMVVGDAMAF